jgi:hypothetical protein
MPNCFIKATKIIDANLRTIKMNITLSRLIFSVLPLLLLLLTACMNGGGGTTATTHPDESDIVSNSATATTTENATAQNLAASTAMSYSP